MSTTTTRPASAKQVSFITSLVAERESTLGEGASQILATLPTLSIADASPLIEWLLAQTKPVQAAPTNYAGPEAERVIISKYASKRGQGCGSCGHPTAAQEAHAALNAGKWTAYHFLGECPSEPVQTSGIDFRAVCEQFGRHSSYNGKEYYTLRLADPAHADTQQADVTRLKVKVSYSPTSGWVNVTDTAAYGHAQQYGTQRPDAEYVGDAVEALGRMVASVARSISAYGAITSHCGCCGRALEAFDSIARGSIGPICWAKYCDAFPADFVAEVEASLAAAKAAQADAEVTACTS